MRIVAPLAMYLVVIGLCIASILIAPSCSSVNCKDPANASNATCVTGKILADCTGASIQSAVTTYGPAIEDAIRNHDDAALELDAIRWGGCVVSEVFSKFVFSKMAMPAGSGSSSTVTPADARERFDRLRAKMWPTTTFKTDGGSL